VPPRFRHRLREQEKDALLTEQAALIDRLMARVQALDARVAELEALLARPKSTCKNSRTPPSQDQKPGGGAGKKRDEGALAAAFAPCGTRRPSDARDETIKRLAPACPPPARPASEAPGNTGGAASSTPTSRRSARTSPGSSFMADAALAKASALLPRRRHATVY
jgi:hypothetical protein